MWPFHILSGTMGKENRENDEHHNTAYINDNLNSSNKFIIEIEVKPGNTYERKQEENR